MIGRLLTQADVGRRVFFGRAAFSTNSSYEFTRHGGKLVSILSNGAGKAPTAVVKLDGGRLVGIYLNYLERRDEGDDGRTGTERTSDRPDVG